MAKRRRSQKAGLGLIGIVLGLSLLLIAIWFVIKFWAPLLLAVCCIMAVAATRNAPQGQRTPWGVTAVGAGLLSLLGFNYVGSQLGQETTSGASNPTVLGTQKDIVVSTPIKRQISASTGQTQPRKPKPPEPQTRQHPMVIDVHDGDTITVKYANGTREKVRLLGIDAPELEQQPHGLQAKTHLRRLILNKRVRLETDVQVLDKFGRRLAYVYSGLGMINQKMIANGWALSSRLRPNIRYGKLLDLAQRRAQTTKNGLWNPRSRLAITPSDWRKGIKPPRKPKTTSRVKPKAIQRIVPESPPAYSARVQPVKSVRDDVYFPNCSAARAAGAAPIQVGEPGYRSRLDRDNDGVACE